MVTILVTHGSRENQVTAVSLAIQKFCAIIAFNLDEDAARTTWTKGSDVNITCEQRINDNTPNSELQVCRIGDWDQKADGLSCGSPQREATPTPST